MKYKAIIFDFDGVIVDSVDIKKDAFEYIFRDLPVDIKIKALDYHVKNSGVSRYVKIRYIYEVLLNMREIDDLIEEKAIEFSDYCSRPVLNAKYIPGAEEFIKKNYNEFNFFVASATPENELNEIVSGRGIIEFFRGVFGSPKTKFEIISSILKENEYKANDVLMIGDAIADHDASVGAGVDFIGVRNKYTNFPHQTKMINDLFDLESILTA